MPVVSSSDTGTDIWNSLSGKSGYNIANQQYDPTRPDQERALALQQRGQQQQLAQAIQARALGQGGPSVAELQGQRALAQGQQQAMQMANSARGVDRAAAFRQAQNAQAGMATEAGSQAAMLRAQEQIQAQQLGGNVNQGIRAQDIESRGISSQEQLGQLNANVQMEQARAKQASEEAEREQKLTGGLAVAAGGLLSMSDERSKEKVKDLGPVAGGPKGYEQNFAQPPEQPSQSDYARAHWLDGMRNSFAMSDERSKEKIRSLSAALDEARGRSQLPAERTVYPEPEQSRRDLAPVQPKEFQYRPEFAQALGDQQGQRHVGVMAQDLEKSPAYAGTVADTPVGKMLATPQQTAVNTAQLGGMDKRVKMLEEALRKAGPRAVDRVNEPVNRPKARGR